MEGIHSPQYGAVFLRACRTGGTRLSFIQYAHEEWIGQFVLELPQMSLDELLSQFIGRALPPVVPLAHTEYTRVWIRRWNITRACGAFPRVRSPVRVVSPQRVKCSRSLMFPRDRYNPR